MCRSIRYRESGTDLIDTLVELDYKFERKFA